MLFAQFFLHELVSLSLVPFRYLYSFFYKADKHHWGDSVSGPPPDDDKSTGSDSDEEESPQVRQAKKISKVKLSEISNGDTF